MKHPKRWIALGAVAATVLIIVLSTNRILTHIITGKIDNSIAQLDSMDIRHGDIRLSVLTGEVWINDVYFQSDTLSNRPDSSRNLTRVEVKRMSLDGVRYWQWIAGKKIVLRGITVHRPQVHNWFTQQNPDTMSLSGLELQRKLKKERLEQQQQFLAIARAFVSEASVERITIRHAHMELNAINTDMRSEVEDASLELYGIGYSLVDTIPYHYNDSVFHFDLHGLSVTLPDGQTHIGCRGITARPGGIIHIDTTRLDTRFSADGKDYLYARMAGLRLGGFNAQKFNETKSLEINSIHIDQPYVDARYNIASTKKKKGKTTVKAVPALTAKDQQESEAIARLHQERMEEIEKQVMMFLTEVKIDTVQVHDISGCFASNSDHLKASVDSLSLGVYGIGYSLIDSIPYHYNDSVFSFSIGHADITTPDGLMRIETSHFLYTDGGSFHIGKTRIRHTCGKWQLGGIKGNTPQAWLDLTIGEVRSRKNLVREAQSLTRGFDLDSLYIRIDKLHIAKDARYKQLTPFPVLQSALLGIHYPFYVRTLRADLRKMQIEVAKTDTHHPGRMVLGPLHLVANNVTAVRNQTIRVKANGKIGKGDIRLGMNIKVNRAGNWDMTLDARHLNLDFLDGFLQPIAGMRIGCDIDHLTAAYGGDGNLATGTFCMEYSSLDLEASKDSPIKTVANLSGLINSFAKTCLPHTNPSRPGKEPRAYKVKWKRDPMEEPTLFFLGPVIDGAIETMLPGIFAINKVQKKEKK